MDFKAARVPPMMNHDKRLQNGSYSTKMRFKLEKLKADMYFTSG